MLARNRKLNLSASYATLIEDYSDTDWFKKVAAASATDKSLTSNFNHILPQHIKVIFLGDIFYNDLRPSTLALKSFVAEICSQMNLSYNETTQTSATLRKLSDEGVLFFNTSAYNMPEEDRPYYRTFCLRLLQRILEKNDNIIVLSFGANNSRLASETGYAEDKLFATGHPSPRAQTSNFRGCSCFRDVNNRLLGDGVLPIRYEIMFK
jgi:uracil DNA glycosylase